MKTSPRGCSCQIEILETRIAPATLDVTGGVLTYTAAVGATNATTISVSSDNYVFADSGEVSITLTAAAMSAGFSNTNATTVQGPNAAVNSISVLLGDQNDTLNVSGVTDPIAANSEAGVDTINVTGAITPGGAVQLTGEAVNINGAVTTASTVTISVNALAIGASVSASGRVTIVPEAAARAIALGTDTGNSLNLTDTELDSISTPNVVQIGDSASGAISIAGALSVTSFDNLGLFTGAGMTQSAAIVAKNVRLLAAGAVTLTNSSNDFDTLAATVTGAGNNFSFRDADALSMGKVDNTDGVLVSGSGAVFTLQAGATTQTERITTGRLELLGAGPYTLTDTTNVVGQLAANITNALTLTTSSALNIGTVGSTSGITTSNSSVSLATVDGNLTVFDTPASIDISAGLNSVSLTAGTAGATDRLLSFVSGSSILAASGATLVGNNLSLGATLNVGSSTVTIHPATAGTAVNLGMADQAGLLGIFDAELDLIQAGQVRISTFGAGDALAVSAAMTPAMFTNLVLAADDMTISAGVTMPTASNSVSLEAFSANRPISLGTTVASNLSLTDAELDFLTTNRIQIGSGTAGNLDLAANIDTANSLILALITGESITRSAGAISESSFSFDAAGNVTLDGTNSVGTVAGVSGGNALFNNGATPLIVGTIGGLVGLNCANVTVEADALNILQDITASALAGSVVLRPATSSTNINLGTEVGGNLSLTSTELGHIHAGSLGALEIGSAASTAAINLSAALTLANANVSTLTLLAGTSISGAGSISVSKLRAEAAGPVTLTGANDVSQLAGKVTTVGQNFSFTDANSFTISSVAGLSGISAPPATAIILSAAGTVTQSVGADV